MKNLCRWDVMDMARVPKRKELVNARLLKDYASWVYCTSCGKTVAYLCYVTYDAFDFTFACACGSAGEVHIAFDEVQDATVDGRPLVPVKNRLCCPQDHAPLVTFVEKNLDGYQCSVVCKGCSTRYSTSKNSENPPAR